MRQTNPRRKLLVILHVLEAMLELLELIQQTWILHAVRLHEFFQLHDVFAALAPTAQFFTSHRVKQLQRAQRAAAIHRVIQRNAELEQL